MHRLIPAFATGLIAACAFATAVAGDVYQWKDAKGVTHYGSVPPASGAYKVRAVNGTDPSLPVAAKPAENPACAIARKNVELLQGKAAVQLDSDGDGKPDKTLSDADRANQLQLAQSTLKVSCAETAGGDKGSSGN
ncbi:MAG: DUF4124 domain-containing protein [Luteimonas sp.]